MVEEDGFENNRDGLLTIFSALTKEEDDPNKKDYLEIVVRRDHARSVRLPEASTTCYECEGEEVLSPG